MNDTKITKERVRNHFSYGWWRYALLLGAAIFGWNLIYTSTGYRPPRDKKMTVYFVTAGVAENALETLSAQILSMFPDLEDASCLSVMYSEGDAYYGDMQLSTFIGAREGDIYVLPRERFEAFAGNGVFIRLDDAAASGAIDLTGIDTARGNVRDQDSGETGLYGIPMDALFGLIGEMGLDNRGLVAGITAYSPEVNQQRGMEWIGWLVKEMLAPMPDWLAERENAVGTPWRQSDEIVEMPSY